MTFGIGSSPKTEDIQKYKDIGVKEIYAPFRFDINYFLEGECKFNENKKKYYREKIPLWIKQGFKVHIHTEQEGSKSKDNPIPTYLGSDKESQDTVKRVKAIIDFMKEVEEDIKKEGKVEGKFGIVEVHCTDENNKFDESTLSNDLKELSKYGKKFGYDIGIEYGKEKTAFKGKVIEDILDKIGNVKLIFDIGLCYHDYYNYYKQHNEEEKTEGHLLELEEKAEHDLLQFFKKNVNKICQIHWNNWNTRKRNGQHRPLFCHGGMISEKTLNKIALKAKEKHIESNLWECYGKLLDNPRMKKDLVFLQKYFGVNDVRSKNDIPCDNK